MPPAPDAGAGKREGWLLTPRGRRLHELDLLRGWSANGFENELLLNTLWTLRYEPFQILVGMAWITALLAARAFTTRGPLL